MKIFAVLSLSAISLFAQPMLTLTVAQPQSNGTILATVDFQDSNPSSNLAGVTLSITAPAGSTFGPVTLLAAATAAQKTILSAGSTFELIGLGGNGGQVALSAGQFFSVSIAPPTTAGPGPMRISLLSPQGVSTVGAPVNLAASQTVYLCSPYDLTGDCLVNQADVNVMQQATLGEIPCTGVLLNIGDGRCSVVDLQEVILAAMGQ
jgi:hypothetical protein